MALQAVGSNPFLPVAFGGNSIQKIGMLSLTILAINTLSNLPVARADIGFKDGAEFTTKICDIVCEPLPGGKNDLPERVCVETCEEGAEIIKTTTKEAMKDGQWKTVEVIGKVFTPIGGYVDCNLICNPAVCGERIAYNLISATKKYLWDKDVTGAVADAASAAAKTACIALLATPAGYAGCMACCAGTKYVGIN